LKNTVLQRNVCTSTVFQMKRLLIPKEKKCHLLDFANFRHRLFECHLMSKEDDVKRKKTQN